MHTVQTLGQLEALFGEVAAPSKRKEVGFLHPIYQQWIEAAPFAVLATSGPGGLDVSPRGDAPGFVQIENQHTLLLPERRGNNRIDSLRNLIADPRLALIFMIPGIGETLRVGGKGIISLEPELLQRFEVNGKPPKCVVVIEVETVFFQCARAIQRSRLWQGLPAEHLAKVPTAGAILEALTEGELGGEKYDAELPERQRTTLY